MAGVKKGIGSPAPDIPKMVTVVGGPEEEDPLSGDRDSEKRIEDFSKQMKASFEERRRLRTSTGTVREDVIWDQIGRKEGIVMVAYLTDCLENDISESHIRTYSWGPEDEHTQSRWETGPRDLSIEDHLFECLNQFQRNHGFERVQTGPLRETRVLRVRDSQKYR